MGLDRTLRGGADLHRIVRHVVDRDGREGRAPAVLLGLVYEGATPAAGAAAVLGSTGTTNTGAALDGRDRRRHVDRHGVRVVVQLSEGLGEVLGVDLLVGCVLEAHLPALGWRGRGADEEELAGVGQLEVAVLVTRPQGRVLAEVDAAALAHDGLAVPDSAHADGCLLVGEGDHDAAEGAKRRPGNHGIGLRDQLADRL